MACMNKKTFDIYHNDQNIVPDNCIEIDELIAPAVQVLNRKGYFTILSCSGHALTDWLINGSDGCWELNAAPYSYIKFKEGVSLPVLPPEFVIETDSTVVIRRNYIVKSFFEISRAIVETMEKLYEWALDLPTLI